MHRGSSWASALVIAWGCVACAGSESVQPLPEAAEAPRFKAVPVDFEHEWRPRSARPLAGAAALDVDGDGREEIFVGGGAGQADVLLAMRDGRLVDVIRNTGLAADTATYAATSFDLDADGAVDLVVARDDGVAVYRNLGSGRFRGNALPLGLPPGSVPVAVAVSDVDRDGLPDLYVSVAADAFHYRDAAFEREAARPNRLMMGLRFDEGGLEIRDATTPVTATSHATNAAVFVDLDDDGLQDLAIAHEAGPVEVLRNVGGGAFEAVDLETAPFGTWLGVAAGDVDADGDLDLLFTNVGSTVSARAARGNLRAERPFTRSWLLLRNDGEFRFVDITRSAGLDRLGFGRGATFADLDLDGRLDLLVAQNPARRLALGHLPGKVLLDVRAAAPDYRALETLHNPTAGSAPLLVDVDGDGHRDLVWINVGAAPRVYRLRPAGDRVRLRLPDEATSLGARAWLEGAGPVPVHEVRAGGGPVDPTAELVLAVPQGKGPLRLRVRWPDGAERVIEDPSLQSILEVRRPQAAKSDPAGLQREG